MLVVIQLIPNQSKQEVNSTVILPPLVFPALNFASSKIRRHDTQHNSIQYNDTQHKGFLRHSAQLTFSINDTQHNNSLYWLPTADCQIAGCRISLIVMLIAIMLSVVMLSVVAPCLLHVCYNTVREY